MPGTADVLPVTVTGSYAKLGHFWLRQFPHSGYVPVTAEAEQAYQVEHYPLCGASPVLVAVFHRAWCGDGRSGHDKPIAVGPVTDSYPAVHARGFVMPGTGIAAPFSNTPWCPCRAFYASQFSYFGPRLHFNAFALRESGERACTQTRRYSAGWVVGVDSTLDRGQAEFDDLVDGDLYGGKVSSVTGNPVGFATIVDS